MGRAGAGSGGGGRSSSGHSSSSRSSGGHRSSYSGGSSRAGSGMRSSPSRTSYGGYHGGYHGGPRMRYSGGGYYRSGGGCLGSIFMSIIGWTFMIIVVWVVVSMLRVGGPSESIPASSYNREPINTGVAYDNDCIIDELGWFDNISRASRDLQGFYNKTGIQPFVYLKSYDPALTTDDEKIAYSEDWYENNINNESTFLFIYFAEQDQDGEVGYMTYVNGKQVTSVMDAEAVDIFWAYVDNNWYTDKSTDQMFKDIFDSTAERIMTKSATKNDVAVRFVGIAFVVIVFIGIMVYVKTKRKHERERNEETARILNADIHSSGSGSGDSLLDRYE